VSPDPSESERFWEAHYARSTPSPGVPRPNDGLVRTMDELALHPGRALELGSGNGGDALWLAEQGWDVTATDASTSADARLTDLARRRATTGTVHAVQVDVATNMPNEEFDLVFACYFQSPIDIDRNAIIRRASQQVGAGGLLVVIDHASVAPWSWHQDAVYPTAEQAHAAMELHQGWAPVVVAARERTALSPADGQTRATVVDNVVVLRREG
jgi:SAM-dependent methyltransferase